MVGAALSAVRLTPWLLSEVMPASGHRVLAWRLRGAVDVDRLAAGLVMAAAEHPALRCGLVEVDGQPREVIVPAVEVSLALHRAGDARAILDAAARRPFDLARAPLWRVCLVRLGTDDHVLGWTSHESAVDAVGARHVLTTALGGTPQPLGPPAGGSPARGGGRQRRAGGVPQALPPARPRPARRRLAGAVLRREFRPPSTVDSVLVARFLTLLHRITGQADIVVGTPVRLAGPTVGTATELLPVRVDASAPPAALVAAVTDAVQEGTGRALSWPELLAVVPATPDDPLTPLIRVSISPLGTPALPGLTAEDWPVDSGAARLDLSVSVSRYGITARYATALFDAGTVERLLADYAALLVS